MIPFFEKKIQEDKKKNSNSFVILKNKVASLFKSPEQERKAMENFDYLCWIESKIAHKPFIEILRKKSVRKKNWLLH